mmetsp:Transcript_42188/g.133213  ORF Transcript_42188/g.133213 Transcript_42188/m.133213 type:complete len:202 (+) Transcript_42188:76-681(+)
MRRWRLEKSTTAIERTTDARDNYLAPGQSRATCTASWSVCDVDGCGERPIASLALRIGSTAPCSRPSAAVTFAIRSRTAVSKLAPPLSIGLPSSSTSAVGSSGGASSAAAAEAAVAAVSTVRAARSRSLAARSASLCLSPVESPSPTAAACRSLRACAKFSCSAHRACELLCGAASERLWRVGNAAAVFERRAHSRAKRPT